MDIGLCLDCMSDAQCSLDNVTVVLDPPNLMVVDPLDLNGMLQAVQAGVASAAAALAAAQEEGKEVEEGEKGDEALMSMPSMICSVTLNPTTLPEPMDVVEEGGGGSKPGTGKPGSKKGKKGKKK